ncbi:MAG: DUF4330 domain-containing protein [Syntrophomonadales bacterium]|jgi:hypothetical protein
MAKNIEVEVAMIDKQGRLFGRISIIDLAIVLAVVLVIFGVFYRGRGTNVAVDPKTVQIKVVCPFVYPDVVPNIKEGDQLVANNQLVPVYIKEVDVRQANTTVSKPDGSMILTENPFRKDIFLVIEGQTTAVSPHQIMLGGQQVRAGKDDYYVKTRTAELKATILNVEVK